MKKIGGLFLFLALVSCKQDIELADLEKLNGYWEITYVDLAEGGKKEYKVNELVDFFELKNLKGFRKKVYPQLDGKYLVTNVSQSIEVVKGDKVILKCATPYSKWSEEIIEIRDSVLVIKNDSKMVYHYKRLTPFSLK
jgi:hypothetical protein